MSHPQKPIASSQRLQFALRFIPRVLTAYATTLYTLFSQLNFNHKAFQRVFRLNVVQNMVGMPLMQMRAGQPTTGQVVEQFCSTENIPLETVEVKSDGFVPAKLYFIDTEASADDGVLLYFHGGGYMFPLSTPKALEYMRKMASFSSRRLVVLEYTLTPEAKYPTQLAQAVAALDLLLKTRKPSQIIVGGDSAGGNLTFALIAHLHQPHPSLKALPVESSDQLAAAFGISPRVLNTTNSPSFTRNNGKDIISKQSVEQITENWKPDVDHVWAAPATGKFWKDIKAKKVLLVVGEDEVYVDDVVDFAADLGAEVGRSDRQYKVCEGEYHDQWIMDMQMGIHDGIMTETMRTWFKSL